MVKCISIAMVLVACGGSRGTTPDGPAVDARPDTPAAQHIGVLAILEGNMVSGTSTAVFGAFGVDNLSTVLSRDDGPCHFEQTATQGATVLDDAGTVTVSGGSNGDIVMTPNSSEQYFATSQSLTFAAGATVAMSGTGSVVPAFSEMLTFPARVTVTSTLAAFSKGSGFSVTWTPTTESVALRVVQHPGGPSDEVNCVFDGGVGTDCPGIGARRVGVWNDGCRHDPHRRTDDRGGRRLRAHVRGAFHRSAGDGRRAAVMIRA